MDGLEIAADALWRCSNVRAFAQRERHDKAFYSLSVHLSHLLFPSQSQHRDILYLLTDVIVAA